MDISSILSVEIGIAILLLLAVFWVKPEYGLFLYGLVLGFPDIAIPLSTAINLRLDDGLIGFFLLRSVLSSPTSLTPGQIGIFKSQVSLAAACTISARVRGARHLP